MQHKTSLWTLTEVVHVMSMYSIVRGFCHYSAQLSLSVYFGTEAAKVGMVFFGNGVVISDGAIIVSPVRSAYDFGDQNADVNAETESLPFKKGFTSMAHAFVMAEIMSIQSSLKSA